jgi:hypothetical protein
MRQLANNWTLVLLRCSILASLELVFVLNFMRFFGELRRDFSSPSRDQPDLIGPADTRGFAAAFVRSRSKGHVPITAWLVAVPFRY